MAMASSHAPSPARLASAFCSCPCLSATNAQHPWGRPHPRAFCKALVAPSKISNPMLAEALEISNDCSTQFLVRSPLRTCSETKISCMSCGCSPFKRALAGTGLPSNHTHSSNLFTGCPIITERLIDLFPRRQPNMPSMARQYVVPPTQIYVCLFLHDGPEKKHAYFRW